ncbi:hypothetical protein FGB62_312g011 [Gracilaria domingensis]|nr:hypothetical protein FGB62_312g011 [Gracilaria domingensis]
MAFIQSPLSEGLPLPAFVGNGEHLDPFSFKPLSRFNSFTTDELSDDFIGGILSLIILSQLYNIVRGLLYFSPGIHQRGYDSYFVFSQISKFRNLHHLFSLDEEVDGPGGDHSHRSEKNNVDIKIAFIPIFAFFALFSTEFLTIIAGTQLRVELSGETNFDPVISVADGTPRTRKPFEGNSFCDDFLVQSRGMSQSGSVLKCVQSSSKWSSFGFKNLLSIETFYGSGETLFQIYSAEGEFSVVDLSTFVRGVNRRNLRTMPFRPELMSDQSRRRLLNGILNGIRSRLGYSALDKDLRLWSSLKQEEGDRLVSMTYGHQHNWNESSGTIANAVIAELRSLDLSLNSSGEPWVYSKPYHIGKESVAMGVRRQYRIAHGYLLIAAAFVTLANVIANTFVTHFDEVAFAAMKEIIDDDCVMGPLVGEP